MPNEVFRHAFDGLCTLVSKRVASEVLRGALRTSGTDPESVDAAGMGALLLGPVRRDLERVLPSRGLVASLESLSRRLRQIPVIVPLDESALELSELLRTSPDSYGGAPDSENDEAGLEPGQLPDRDDPARSLPAREPMQTPIDPKPTYSPLAPEPARPMRAPESTHPPLDRETTRPLVDAEPTRPPIDPEPTHSPLDPEPASPRVDSRQPRIQAGPSRSPGAPTAGGPRSFDRLELIERLAVMDEVRLLASFDGDGSVEKVLGDGLDAVELGRTARLALRLLGRRESVRTLHLQHASGELFLFPHPRGLVAVAGSTALNLGAVLATFSSLAVEEDS